jgi:hypothetical protein
MVLTRAGNFCGKSDLGGRIVAKCDVRQSLVYIARFHSGARPSRGSLKQVYNYLLNKQELKQGVKCLSLPWSCSGLEGMQFSFISWKGSITKYGCLFLSTFALSWINSRISSYDWITSLLQSSLVVGHFSNKRVHLKNIAANSYHACRRSTSILNLASSWKKLTYKLCQFSLTGC